MSVRPLLEESRIDPAIRETVARFHPGVVERARRAIDDHDVVVIGMAQNPYVKKARKALEEAGVAFEYIEHGSYFSAWKPRLALKMWSGWPTFPMVFVQGTLVGGFAETEKLLERGELKRRLSGTGEAAPAAE
jgi:glutaredoxin-related protein